MDKSLLLTLLPFKTQEGNITEEWQEEYKCQQVRMGAMQRRLKDVTWILHKSTHSTHGYLAQDLNKIKLSKIPG